MSDITDRLRHSADLREQGNGSWGHNVSECREAADRIDELEVQAETARQGFELIAALLWANRRPQKLSIELETLNAYREAVARGIVNQE